MIQIEDAPARDPGPAEVVVRVAGTALGVQPGAEVAGVVEAAGAASTEWLGRRVVVPRVLPCGECERCRRGRAAACRAQVRREGLRLREVVPARALCSVEPPLWPFGAGDETRESLWMLAALADAVATPYGALVRAGVAPGELVVVLGGGPRGAAAVALARALGAHPVLITAHAGEAERGRALGAAQVLEADRAPGEHAAELERLAAELGAPSSGGVVLDATASAAGRHLALALVPDGGTALLLDGGDDQAQVLNVPPPDWERLARREAQVIGVSACHPDLFPELCALVCRGELLLPALVARVRPEDAEAALAARRAGRLLSLPIVTP